MLKVPYGISDYKTLKEEGYCYVDKTMYLEKLENVRKVITYLRPGRFGKSLFTSMMYYYYDVNSKDDFDNLFKDTYVSSNPTINKNNYYVLKFDFSGMTSFDKDSRQLELEFIRKVSSGIKEFNNHYGTSANTDYNDITPNGLILDFLDYFRSLKLNHKLYIIIDEYDNFTNAILEGKGDRFKSIAGNEGFLKAFYSEIKEYCGRGVVDRVFITGICPITLDSMTTGFNTSTDISTDVRFNEMIGLTHEEVCYLIKDIDENKKEEIFDLMLKNYDGYLFSKKSNTRVFNATLVMYFLSHYYEINEIPDEILDGNIAFNYGKVANLLKLQNNEFYEDILDTILKTGTIEGELKSKFNLELKFKRDDVISLLYYFGYLTIKEVSFGSNVIFEIPNYVMNTLYTNYFLQLLEEANPLITFDDSSSYLKEIILEGKIDVISKYVERILKLSDNRIFMKFDEKYVQLLYFSLLINKKEFHIYSEYQTSGGYVDLMIFKNMDICKNNIMIELKYIKKSDYDKDNGLLEVKRKEAISQLLSYSEDDRLDKTNLKRYVVIFVGNDLKLLEEV